MTTPTPRTNSMATALVFSLLLMVFVNACNSDPEAAASGTAAARPSGPVPEQQFFDYRLIESSAGIKQWVLQSVEMQKFSGQKDVVLFDVIMDFFQDGEHFSILTADSGRANLTTRNVHTWGNVVVVTDDGRRLVTEELYFNNETELIHNDVFNHFTKDSDVLTGIGLEATPDLKYIELKHDVKAGVADAATPAKNPKADNSE